MASNASMEGFSFSNVRPSPTNPHKPPRYIKPVNIQKDFPHRPSNPHLDPIDNPRIGNGGPFVDHNNITFDPGPSTDTFDPRPGTSRDYVEMKLEKKNDDKMQEEKKLWWCKFISGIVVVLVAIVGTIYFVLYYTHPRVQAPNAEAQILTTTTMPPNKECTRSLEEIGFNDVLMLNCEVQLSGYHLTRLSILFEPRYGSYLPSERVNFNLTESFTSDHGWNISLYNNTMSSTQTGVILTKEPAKCGSGGRYILEFFATANNSTAEKIVLTHQEDFEIISRVSDVNLYVVEDNTTKKDGDFYEISCSAQSDCSPAPIMLLGIFNNNNNSVPIFGVNFTCIINYNDNDGWTVKCTGTIPANVYSSLTSIACRPTTGNQTIDDEKEIKYKICRDCIFECPDEDGDSYWYDHLICNIFHRCVNSKLYTSPCPPKTYFNPDTCSCDHTNNLPGKCDENNERVEIKGSGKASCTGI